MILQATQTHQAGRVFETPGLVHDVELTKAFSNISLTSAIMAILFIRTKEGKPIFEKEVS